jgi:hypothetical protein
MATPLKRMPVTGGGNPCFDHKFKQLPPRYILQEDRQRQVSLLLFEGMAMSWSSALRTGYGPARQDLALDADLDVKTASICVQYSQCA